MPEMTWTERNRRNIERIRSRSPGAAIECCPECGALVEVRYTAALAGWLMQARKGPEHAEGCSAFVKEGA